MITMQTYSSKATAKKGAIRQKLDIASLEFLQNSEGRWFWTELDIDPIAGTFTYCPHCGIHLDNGWHDNSHFIEGADVDAESLEFLCLGCGCDFGEKIAVPAKKPASESKETGLKIEKERPEQNGIIRPSEGGKCRAIWDFCDALTAKGVTPMPKLLKESAETHGWNANNAVIEMYQWRKFNGITGRVS
jgi:hypothetical protein